MTGVAQDLVHADVVHPQALVRSSFPRRQPVLRLATDADWWRYLARPLPLWWTGMTLEDEYMLLGLGGVYLGTDKRLWAFFTRARGVSIPISMQKGARILFASLAEAGVKEISAVADEDVAGSEFWMKRLGFTPTDQLHKGLTIWTWTPGGPHA